MNSTPPRHAHPVRRRLVLQVGGYEPLPPASHHRRLRRTLERSATAWGLRLDTQPETLSGDGAVQRFGAGLAGPDWQTEAEVVLLGWDDLIARDLAVPLPLRILRGGAALARLLADGTVGRYRRAHWRYLLFMALPLLLLGGALLAGLLAGLALGGAAGFLLGMAIALVLIRLGDRHAHLGHLFADWAFARALARDARPDVAARVARFAAEIASARGRRDVQEVVLIGHTLGRELLVEALAQALARPVPLGGPRLVLVGLGSSVLKIGLMPEATRLRAAVARVAAEPGLEWLEVTSRRDLLSFHRADPLRCLGLPGRGPRMARVHPRAMLDAAGWRRVRLSMLRAHRIYVTGHDRPYHYDWGLLVCGPGPAGRMAEGDPLLGPGGALLKVAA